MLDAIDSAQYVGAAALLTRANQELAAGALALFDALGDAALSAGRGDGARRWCDGYEHAAGTVADGISRLIDALGGCARLIDASGHNHARAEAAAAPYGLPSYALPQRDLATVGITGIPSIYGGTDGEPWGWSLIASHLDGLGWPGADLGRLRTLARAWHTAAGRLRDVGYAPGQAAAELELMTSPELPDAIAVCHRLGKAALTLADDCDALGASCTRYADSVGNQRPLVGRQVEEFFAAAGVTELVGYGLSVISAGVSALVAKAADAGILTTYITRITGLLEALDDSLAGSGLALAGAGAGVDAAWLGMVARSEPVLAEVSADNALLATEIDAAAAGGGLGGSEGLTDITVRRMWRWEKETPSHTIARHVGRTIEQLKQRIAEGHEMVSTFPDLESAAASISRTVKANEAKLREWLSGSGRQTELEATFDEPVGTVMTEEGHTFDGHSVKLIVRRDPTDPFGFRIHTAMVYP